MEERADQIPVVTEPASDARLLRAVFAHDLAQGLSALRQTVEAMVKLCDRDQGALSGEEWMTLRELAHSMDEETDAQLYQALTLLWEVMPEFAIGLERPKLERILIMDLVRGMIGPYEAKARRRGIAVEFRQEHDDGAMPRILVEVNTIRRVIHNALTNALKYSYTGSNANHRFIRIWCQRHDSAGREWAFRIQNYGIGVEPEELSEVFKPGYRGKHACEENTFGTGLGLSDIRSAMGRHGGRVTIESTRLHEDTFLTTLCLVFPVQTSIRRHYEAGHAALDR